MEETAQTIPIDWKHLVLIDLLAASFLKYLLFPDTTKNDGLKVLGKSSEDDLQYISDLRVNHDTPQKARSAFVSSFRTKLLPFFEDNGLFWMSSMGLGFLWFWYDCEDIAKSMNQRLATVGVCIMSWDLSIWQPPTNSGDQRQVSLQINRASLGLHSEKRFFEWKNMLPTVCTDLTTDYW